METLSCRCTPWHQAPYISIASSNARCAFLHLNRYFSALFSSYVTQQRTTHIPVRLFGSWLPYVVSVSRVLCLRRLLQKGHWWFADVCDARCQRRFTSPLIFPVVGGITNGVSGGEANAWSYAMRGDAECMLQGRGSNLPAQTEQIHSSDLIGNVDILNSQNRTIRMRKAYR